MLSRYYPSDIDMHSFENVTSTELKRANWMVLEKLFKARAHAHSCVALSSPAAGCGISARSCVPHLRRRMGAHGSSRGADVWHCLQRH